MYLLYMEIMSEKKQLFRFFCQILGCFISIVRLLHMFFCLVQAQSLCYLIHLRDLGALHFKQGFLRGPKKSHVSYFIIFNVFIFPYFGQFKVFIFQYFDSLERVSWFITLYMNYVKICKKIGAQLCVFQLLLSSNESCKSSYLAGSGLFV